MNQPQQKRKKTAVGAVVDKFDPVFRRGTDSAVARTFEQHPRDNFDRVLLDFTWRVARREPWTLVKGIFF